MSKKNKLLSLFLALLMMTAAAITVNKSLFGHEVKNTQTADIRTVENNDSVISVSDGVTVIHTSALPGMINGYAGPVNLDICLTDGKISEIKPLPNTETPSFFNRASTLLSAWDGKTPAEALDMKVDAISGATYSSQAIISNVNTGLAYYVGTTAHESHTIPWKIWIALGVTLAACVFPLFVKNRIYHYAQFVANVIVLGFWCGQFLDYALILKYLSGGFALSTGLVAAVMLVAAFIYPLFGHPQHYCNHICPLGAAQQLAAQLCGYKFHISKKVLKGLDWFRKILWAVLMLLLWADILTGWMDLELFRAFRFESAPWGIILAACLFVALSAVISRPYCRFVCPTGSLFKRAENIG